jgi:DNA-binding protein H-NS
MMSKFLNHPLYVRAKEMFENIRIRQIQKGAEKYPEPLNPKSWSIKQLTEHGLMELADLLHYIVALLEKAEALEQRVKELENIETYYEHEKQLRKDAENRAELAEKERNDTLVTAERERRKWQYKGQ